MKPVKSHLDFTSENQPGPCFRDLSYTPYDANITNSRRLHLAAYFKFMRPQASSLYDEYAAEARRTACKILYNDTMQRAVSVAYFEYLVDNVFWKLWCEFDYISTVAATDTKLHSQAIWIRCAFVAMGASESLVEIETRAVAESHI
jgi:hypothetical protein